MIAMSKKLTGFTAEAEAVLREYEWPGNIRELRNTLERSVLLSEKDWIRPDDLSLHGADGMEPLNDVDTFQLPEGGLMIFRTSFPAGCANVL